MGFSTFSAKLAQQNINCWLAKDIAIICTVNYSL